jgi:superfamily I DNA/RNA helicase
MVAGGLQFRIVVLLWADLLPSSFKDRADAEERSLLYVALTRAIDMLAVLYSGNSVYLDELNRSLGIATA